MQEEITGRTVTLIVNGSKMTEQVFEKAMKKFLEEIQKSKQPKIYRGRQTLKQLAGQNAGLSNIEISDKNIRAFTSVAKKYHVDFALKKDTAAEQPRYLVFFKSRDADNLEQAFKEFTAKKLSREAKPSIRKALSVLREAAGRNVQRDGARLAAKEKI
ncbi:PcfB family protein, partial [Oscillospiraceae bacterium 44-5]